MLRLEIRETQNGYVICCVRAPTLVFCGQEPDDAKALMAAVSHGEIMNTREPIQVIDPPPVEWTARNTDEALTIARSILEGTQ